jgi:hypothetical protein
MGMIDDILKALDRIPIWKRLQQVPSEVDELQSRIAVLEEKLGGKWPADVCRYCGERAARLTNHRGPDNKGVFTEIWTCAACSQKDHRHVKP